MACPGQTPRCNHLHSSQPWADLETPAVHQGYDTTGEQAKEPSWEQPSKEPRGGKAGSRALSSRHHRDLTLHPPPPG